MIFDRQRILKGSAFALCWLAAFALAHIVFQLLAFDQDFWRNVFHATPLDVAACVASYHFAKKFHGRFFEARKTAARTD